MSTSHAPQHKASSDRRFYVSLVFAFMTAVLICVTVINIVHPETGCS